MSEELEPWCPLLAHMARSMLAMSTSIVASELTFSTKFKISSTLTVIDIINLCLCMYYKFIIYFTPVNYEFC